MIDLQKTELVSGSTDKALLLDEIKDWLRLERGYTYEDNLLTDLRDAAVNMAEEYLGRKLLTQTWNVYFDKFPSGELVLPFGPLQGLASASTSVIYVDKDGTQTTFSSTKYSVDTISDPGSIVLEYGETWPIDTLRPRNPIRVDFITGYGDVSSDVPSQIRNAMKRYIGDLHEHREDSIVGQGQTVVVIPYGVKEMLRPFKQNYGAF